MSAGGDPLRPLADGLLPSAMRHSESRGRIHPEPEHAFRNPFQRDRDRVVHAASFRRLEYKTQVFVTGEGDNYRTRLTHTLEVAQIGRTLARALCLNEDLTEAVALSHDLGHTPYGHAGERVLDRLLAGAGGFNHNLHGLRVVDVLEKRYAAFAGLNLTYETREAFVRHAGGRREVAGFPPGDAPLLEVAATIVADDIAYIAHDIDDGLYSRLLDDAMLQGQPLWRAATGGQLPGYSGLPPALKRVEGVRRLINLLVGDAIAASRERIAAAALLSTADVRARGHRAIAFSERVEEHKDGLKRFLSDNFYRHPALVASLDEAQRKLAALFGAYASGAGALPEEYRRLAAASGPGLAAADYVAGMTDRFASDDYARLFGSGQQSG